MNSYYFCCIDKDDVYTVYDALAENIRLKNPAKDLINFQYLMKIARKSPDFNPGMDRA